MELQEGDLPQLVLIQNIKKLFRLLGWDLHPQQSLLDFVPLTNLHKLLLIQGAATVEVCLLKDLPQKLQFVEHLSSHASILQFLIALRNVQSVLHYDAYDDV